MGLKAWEFKTEQAIHNDEVMDRIDRTFYLMNNNDSLEFIDRIRKQAQAIARARHQLEDAMKNGSLYSSYGVARRHMIRMNRVWKAYNEAARKVAREIGLRAGFPFDALWLDPEDN